jgi:hypothetical protein
MKFILTSHFSMRSLASVFQNCWKHRGTENAEEDDFKEQIACQGKYYEITLGSCSFEIHFP